MGATAYDTYGYGETVQHAFMQACGEARDSVGPQEGYSGDIQNSRRV